MASLAHGISNVTSFCEKQEFLPPAIRTCQLLQIGRSRTGSIWRMEAGCRVLSRKPRRNENPRCSISGGEKKSSSPLSSSDEKKEMEQKPFGYTRKDVLLIGVGVTAVGVGLKSGLEYVGVDPLQAGNAVQLIMVLGLTLGWISTYIFRVSNKEMTYAQQLRDYENKVMQKRLESLSEAELEAFLEQVEEEKRRLERADKVDL